MKKIFLAPRSGEQSSKNFQKTIEGGYQKKDIKSFLKEDDLDALRDHDVLYIWGNRPGGYAPWNEMKKDDFIFFYQHGKITYIGQLLHKSHNKELADQLWGPFQSKNTIESWEYTYFLHNLIKVDIDYKILKDLAGYSPNAVVQGFQSYRENGIQALNEKYGSIENFVKKFTAGGDSKVITTAPINKPELDPVIEVISHSGFIFEPWQIAAYITALRTKPFVILAGVTGTGKSKLPKLVSEATGGVSKLISVRPDWTDSSDVLGYCSLNDKFRPGQLLEFVQKASESPDKHHVCIIDEMNIARVEHYFAEILSRIEDRRKTSNGGFESSRLLGQELSGDDARWSSYGLQSNLAIVGTVNMDESSHGFSRKVLDRAFTIELSDIDLTKWESAVSGEIATVPWPAEKWYPRAIQLSQIGSLTELERKEIDRVIKALIEINKFLVHAQLQVGYRTRDEIAMFVMHAQDYKASFVTNSGVVVDPLDLALLMKVLPRIVGGSSPVRRAILQLLGWAVTGKGFQTDEDAKPTIDLWESGGRPGAVSEALYPRTAARLCLMWDRLLSEGFTSFWL